MSIYVYPLSLSRHKKSINSDDRANKKKSEAQFCMVDKLFVERFEL